MSWPEPFQAVAAFGLCALSAACGVDERQVSTSKAPNDPVGAGGNGVGAGGNGSSAGGSTSSGSMLDVGCTGMGCGATGSRLAVGCGDGVRAANEACDDGNRSSGDGCSEDCRLAEPGFSCAIPGEPCLPIARCGDGFIAPTEQCDDANTRSGDGCSARCQVELGRKCSGQPSVCSDAACGNGIREGNEACDDGNVQPFDGCSAHCTKEPGCAGGACVSECGDGEVLGEGCDDGNLTDGDGCSSLCRLEAGFSCLTEAPCEQLSGQCVLRLPTLFRDFSDTHPDFGNKSCTTREAGAVASRLDARGLPVLNTAAAARACLSSAASFDEWYTNNASNTSRVAELLLFDDGAGGYVNRFGAEGQQFAFVDPGTERDGGTSLVSCSDACRNEARAGLAPFGGPLRCEDQCRPLADQRDQLSAMSVQLQAQLTQAMSAALPDALAIADLQGQIAAIEAQLSALEQEFTRCQADCQAQLDARAAPCIASCKPCSADATRFCIGGQPLYFDGTPLFFPVDGLSGAAPAQPASIPVQYGATTVTPESTLFPGAPNHNFYFSSEAELRFQYKADTRATLTLEADDDVWVFLNGQLTLDLGGVHEPLRGTLIVDAPAGVVTTTVPGSPASSTPTGNLGLVPGSLYTLSIFHAERQAPVSSLLLALSGFEAKTSQCSPVCGDGLLSQGEECDDGINDGGYGKCAPGCLLGPYCGDGITQPEFGEACDVGADADATCRGCRVLAN